MWVRERASEWFRLVDAQNNEVLQSVGSSGLSVLYFARNAAFFWGSRATFGAGARVYTGIVGYFA